MFPLSIITTKEKLKETKKIAWTKKAATFYFTTAIYFA